ALAFELLPQAHVARDLRRADDLPAGAPDRRHRDRHLDAAAVLPQTFGLEMVYASSGPQGREDVGLFMEAVGRNDRRDRLPDDLVGAVAEEALRTRVPA